MRASRAQHDFDSPFRRQPTSFDRVPLPTVVCLAFATGVLAALAGRAEIKLSPRHPLLTRSFSAYAIFAACVLLPVSVYFYVFHGDWFLLYLLDVRSVPSAIALVGFVVELAIGAAGFAAGSTLLRNQREAIAGALGALVLGASVGIPLLLHERLARVGSLAQFDGGFGLVDFTAGPLFLGSIGMSLVVFIGASFLYGRLWLGERR